MISRAASRTSSERPSATSLRPSISALSFSRVRSDAGILSIGVLLRGGRSPNRTSLISPIRRGCTPTLFPASLGLHHQNRRRLQKPEGIFLIAEQFLAVARLPIRLKNVDHSILSPYTSYEAKALIRSPEIAYMACAAFALELYFKCLIRYERKSFGGLHDLSKLFNLIGKSHRVKIKKCWGAHSQQVKSELCQRRLIPLSQVSQHVV